MAELLADRAAVAHGLSAMAVDMLFDALPGLLREVVGFRQAAVLLERLASRAAEKGFREFTAKLGLSGPLDPLRVLGIFLLGRERLHPFQVFKLIETGDGRIRLIPAQRMDELSAALLAGVVAGVLAAAGHPARALVERAAVEQLCRSGVEVEAIVYPEPGGSVVIEFLDCSRDGDVE